MTAQPPSRSYAVGEENVLVVGVQGVVTAMTHDTITLGGHTLPRLMGAGVRYLSMLWPDPPCEREHCTSDCSTEPSVIYEDLREDLDALVQMIRTRHDETHSEGMRFCSDPICRDAFEKDGAL